MTFFKLAMKSLKNRSLTTVLTILSIGLSVALLLSIERSRRAAYEGFTQTISKTELIVGARSGPIQLIFYTVFNMGNATHNISYETFKKISQHPKVAWTIPYSLGDGHRGYRVVGTNNDFFKHYHYRGDNRVALAKGQEFQGIWDVVVGAEVAENLNYDLHQKIVVSHGVTKGMGLQHHDDKPFVIKGILEKTGTALDRAVYVSLEGLEALHIDWASGAAPTPSQMIAADKINAEELKVHSITSFFLGTKSKIDTLGLQREINNFADEPLLAIIPGATLSELWNGLSYVESVLKLISVLVIGVGLVAMLISLTTSLNERRREMAILRAIGASSQQIVGLLVFESFLITAMGIVAGVVISVGGVLLLKPWLESQFGLYLVGAVMTPKELLYLLITLICGTLIGLVPALKAQSQALKDGLSIKT